MSYNVNNIVRKNYRLYLPCRANTKSIVYTLPIPYIILFFILSPLAQSSYYYLLYSTGAVYARIRRLVMKVGIAPQGRISPRTPRAPVDGQYCSAVSVSRSRYIVIHITFLCTHNRVRFAIRHTNAKRSGLVYLRHYMVYLTIFVCVCVCAVHPYICIYYNTPGTLYRTVSMICVLAIAYVIIICT